MRFLLVLVLSFVCPQTWAQQLEIYSLRYRLPEQVMPALQSMLGADANISALNNKIMVRAAPNIQAQVRKAIEALDTPVRRLEISLRQGDSSTTDSRDIGVRTGSIEVTREGVQGRAVGGFEVNSGRSQNQVMQKVQTVEGGHATIFVGKSLALPVRQVVRTPQGMVVTDSTSFMDVGNSLVVRPELVGERVILNISPQASRMTSGGIETARLSTTVSGRLGEWISLGGVSVEQSQQNNGMLSYSAGQRGQDAQFWIKVDVSE